MSWDALRVAGERLARRWPPGVVDAVEVLAAEVAHNQGCGVCRRGDDEDLVAAVGVLSGEYDPALAELADACVVLAGELRLRTRRCERAEDAGTRGTVPTGETPWR